MSNRYTVARKKALRYLGLDEASDMPYTDIAKRITFKDCSIVEGLDLNNKLHARELISTWAYRRNL